MEAINGKNDEAGKLGTNMLYKSIVHGKKPREPSIALASLAPSNDADLRSLVWPCHYSNIDSHRNPYNPTLFRFSIPTPVIRVTSQVNFAACCCIELCQS